MCRMAYLGLVWLTISCCVAVCPAHGQTIHVSISGKPLVGKPVHWNPSLVAIMERDGRLATFHPSKATDYRQVDATFRSYTQAALRGELQREFGRGFEVSGTGQYLVVHPAGQRDLWAERFEQLYRSMQHYLVARGFRIQRPEFPLVAVVFPSQDLYLAYAAKQGRRISTATLGYYDPDSNRIHMYDTTASRQNTGDWQTNAETIIHEAAHQTAFNIGIHDRLAISPRWLVEGLGTLFESPGVWDARSHPEREKRIHRLQLDAYRRRVNDANAMDIMNAQLASDQLFQRDPLLAYAHAWALTFFMTEQMPRQYAEYIARVNKRPPFVEYSPEERLRDFQAAFGGNLTMFNAHLQRFVKTL